MVSNICEDAFTKCDANQQIQVLDKHPEHSLTLAESITKEVILVYLVLFPHTSMSVNSKQSCYTVYTSTEKDITNTQTILFNLVNQILKTKDITNAEEIAMITKVFNKRVRVKVDSFQYASGTVITLAPGRDGHTFSAVSTFARRPGDPTPSNMITTVGHSFSPLDNMFMLPTTCQVRIRDPLHPTSEPIDCEYIRHIIPHDKRPQLVDYTFTTTYKPGAFVDNPFNTATEVCSICDCAVHRVVRPNLDTVAHIAPQEVPVLPNTADFYGIVNFTVARVINGVVANVPGILEVEGYGHQSYTMNDDVPLVNVCEIYYTARLVPQQGGELIERLLYEGDSGLPMFIIDPLTNTRYIHSFLLGFDSDDAIKGLDGSINEYEREYKLIPAFLQKKQIEKILDIQEMLPIQASIEMFGV